MSNLYLPKLSIITINYNNKAGLEQTLESVCGQRLSNFEFIIIDGGSTDDSQKVIENHADRISHWGSEPDNGIYHAMNKGIAAANGEYLLFLNSGDWLAGNTVLEQVFAQNPTADIVSGDICFYDTEKKNVRWHVPSPDQLTAKTLFLGTLPHQATFIRRELFHRFGPYNESLQVVADWLFFLEVLLERNCTYEHIPLTISYFAMDGISCSPSAQGLPRREQLAALNEKYPRFVPDYEQLERLENQESAWQNSREYTVYQWLKKWGFISAGIFVMRSIRFVKQKITAGKLIK